jgi:hypothetical protein
MRKHTKRTRGGAQRKHRDNSARSSCAWLRPSLSLSGFPQSWGKLVSSLLPFASVCNAARGLCGRAAFSVASIARRKLLSSRTGRGASTAAGLLCLTCMLHGVHLLGIACASDAVTLQQAKATSSVVVGIGLPAFKRTCHAMARTRQHAQAHEKKQGRAQRKHRDNSAWSSCAWLLPSLSLSGFSQSWGKLASSLLPVSSV